MEKKIDCLSGVKHPEPLDLSLLKLHETMKERPQEVVDRALVKMAQRADELLKSVERPEADKERAEASVLVKRAKELAELRNTDPAEGARRVKEWARRDEIDRNRVNECEIVIKGNPEYNLIRKHYTIEQKDSKVVVTETVQRKQVPIWGYHNWGAQAVGKPTVSIRTYSPTDLVPVGPGSYPKMVPASELTLELDSQKFWGNVSGCAGIAMDAGLLVSGGIGGYTLARLGVSGVGRWAAARTAGIGFLGATSICDGNAGALSAAPNLVSALTSVRHTLFAGMIMYDTASLAKAGLRGLGLVAEAPKAAEMTQEALALASLAKKDTDALLRWQNRAEVIGHGANVLFAGSQGKQFVDRLNRKGERLYGK